MKNPPVKVRYRTREGASTEVMEPGGEARTDVPQPGSNNFDDRVRETLMTYLGKQGNFMDRGITLRDLLASGIVELPAGWRPGAGGGGMTPPLLPVDDGKADLTPPPNVEDFKVTPGISVVFFETGPPQFVQGHGYLRTNIYGKAYDPAVDPLPVFADAKLVYSYTGEVGSWATQPSRTFAFWAKWETNDGVESPAPAGGTNGISVTTGQDVALLVEAMTGPGKPFKEVTEPITLPDGTVVPVGVYISDAYIHRMQVVTAMIHDLAVTSAKIQSLAADKITSGEISVGQEIRSSGFVHNVTGWSISGNGLAEFSNVIARGAIFASSGTIGGAEIGADYVESTNYEKNVQGWRLENSTGNAFINELYSRGAIMGGDYTQFLWPPAGGTGFYLGVEGLSMGNINNTPPRWFNIDALGDVRAPGFTIVGGNATFSGKLQAASGDFVGNFHAGSISVGEAGTPVTFYDDAYPAIALRSVGQGSFNYNSETSAAVVTHANVKFTTGDSGAVINQRVRTGTVRFLITAFCLADHYFSLWYRKNGGAWTFLTMAVEPAGSYGSVSAGFAGEVVLAGGDYVEFGMSATDSAGGHPGGTELKNATFNVLAFNF